MADSRIVPECKVSLEGTKLEGEKDAALLRVDVDLDVDLFGAATLFFNDPKLAFTNGKDFKPGTAVKVEIGYGSKLTSIFEGEVVALEPQFRTNHPVTLRVHVTCPGLVELGPWHASTPQRCCAFWSRSRMPTNSASDCSIPPCSSMACI